MLDTCSNSARKNDILFNRDKSVCMAVGFLSKCHITDMMLGDKTIKWVNSFKYLGIQFVKGVKLAVDCDFIKRRFYAACNGILYNCSRAAESVKVFLVVTYCLPILLYCLGALCLNVNNIKALNVCWNDALRKIYGLHRWESVRQIMFFCNLMPIKFHYDLCQWKFHSVNALAVHGSSAYKRHIGNVSSMLCTSLLHKYSPDGSLHTICKRVLTEHFKGTVIL